MKNLILLLLTLALSNFMITGNAGIVYPTAPDGGAQAVSHMLDSHFMQLSFFKQFHLPPVKDLTIARPFAVSYSFDYTNLLCGRFLSEVKTCSWRFLLTDGTNSVGAMDLGYDNQKGAWQQGIGGVFYKSYADFSTGLQVAEQLPEVKKEDYELRYLNFLQGEFFAIWLHGKSNDTIIPLPPAHGECQPYRPYSEQEIIRMLKDEMEKEMRRPKKPGYPVG